MKLYKSGLFILVLLMLFSNIAFAGIDDRLEGHWAKGTLNEEFTSHYFPYFARDGFNDFNPNSFMTKDRFSLSVASLFKSKGYIVLGMENPGDLTRKEMLKIVGSRLAEIGVNADLNYILEFTDIQGLSSQYIDYLKILNKEKIVIGVGKASFNPNNKLTQAEAVVVLQRLNSFLDRLSSINFVTKSVENSYNGKEEIITIINDDSIILSITKEFPTPGYTIAVKEIHQKGKTFKVQLLTKAPPEDSMQLQVLTYKTIVIEIGKEGLGEGPYNFIVEGE